MSSSWASRAIPGRPGDNTDQRHVEQVRLVRGGIDEDGAASAGRQAGRSTIARNGSKTASPGCSQIACVLLLGTNDGEAVPLCDRVCFQHRQQGVDCAAVFRA